MSMELPPHQALDLWRLVLQENVRKKIPDLSSRQLAIALTVYLTPPPHTVRGLAKLFNIPKPAITRALDRLSILGLVRRKRDEADRRNVLVQRTVKGSVFFADFGASVTQAATGAEAHIELRRRPAEEMPQLRTTSPLAATNSSAAESKVLV